MCYNVIRKELSMEKIVKEPEFVEPDWEFVLMQESIYFSEVSEIEMQEELF